MPVANRVNCDDPYDEERDKFVLYAEGGEFRCALPVLGFDHNLHGDPVPGHARRVRRAWTPREAIREFLRDPTFRAEVKAFRRRALRRRA